MIDKNSSRKLFSILVICILIVAGIVVILPSSPIVSKVEGASVWVQTTDTDFDQGTLSNIEIIDSGTNARITLTSDEWSQITPSLKPSKRINHTIAAVGYSNKYLVLLFGGFDGNLDNETWIYDFGTSSWANKNPSGMVPSARHNHGLAGFGDPVSGNALLFGGNDSSLNDETWVYVVQTNTWVKQNPLTKPSARSGHAMDSFDNLNEILLFGGNDGSRSDETWIYSVSGGDWTKKNTIGKPSAREKHALTHIDGDDKIVLFGGYDGSYDDETWVYDLTDNRWRMKTPVGGIKPSIRRDHAMANIYSTDKVILFGGFDGSNYLNDTWMYDVSDNKWIKLHPLNSPSYRGQAAMATLFKSDNHVMLFGGYHKSGSISNRYDDTWYFIRTQSYGDYYSLNKDTGGKSSFKYFSCNCSKPAGTTIKIYIRTASTESGLSSKSWVGPDGTSGTYYPPTNSYIHSSHNGDRWIQYKVNLSTTNVDNRPNLEDITIIYNQWPTNPLLTTPLNNTLLNNNTPTFTWSFEDIDSIAQSAFEIEIDDDNQFNSPDYGGQIISSIASYKPSLPIADGDWYWRVRTKDSDGSWGPFSIIRKIIIDATIPGSFKPAANPNSWTINTQPVITFATIDNGSGIDYYNISIDSGSFSTQTSPYTLPPQTEGIHNITVRAYDYAGNHRVGYVDVYIDTVKPANFKPTANPSSWTINTQPLITFATTDITSMIDYYQVAVDTGTYTNQISPYTLPSQTDGVHNITVRAYDMAGNYRDGYIDIYIDTTKPLDFTPTANPSGWTANSQPEISFSTTDTTSTINYYKVKIDNGGFTTQISPYKLPSQDDGIHNITIRAYDMADNYMDAFLDVFIDTTSPSITHTPTNSATKNHKIIISAIVTDEYSGIDNVLLFFKKPLDQTYSQVLMNPANDTYSAIINADTVTEGGLEYYLKAVDKSTPGNIIYYGENGITTIEPASLTDINIQVSSKDITPPTITHIPVTTGTVGAPIIISATVTDDASGVDSVELFYKIKTDDIYSSISMSKDINTFSAELPKDIITTAGIEYYIKATDKASPINIAYFGINGQVSEIPSSLDDIDITILEKDTNPPTILEKYPTGNNVLVGTTVSIIFSEAMDKSASEKAFTISPSASGSFSWDKNKLIFTPNEALVYNVTYEIIISTNARDLAGNNLELNYSWEFTTTSVIDIIPPKILEVSPEGIDVPFDIEIRIKFNEPMLKEDTEDAFALSPKVDGTFKWIGETFVFIPNQFMEPDREYEVTISTNAKDLVGNSLESNYIWKFTTISIIDVTAPEVINFTPTGFNVQVNTSISVEFSEAMLKKDTESSFSITPNINVSTTWNSNILIFTPTDFLYYNTTYKIIISTDAKDLLGNKLESEVKWQFKTISLMNITAPIVVNNFPKGSDVDINTQIRITFNKAMLKSDTESAVSILPNINGSFQWEDNTLIFTPASGLKDKTEYTLTISTSAKDQFGNKLESEFKWSFTTEEKSEDKDDTGMFGFGKICGIDIFLILLIIIIIIILLLLILRRKKPEEEKAEPEKEESEEIEDEYEEGEEELEETEEPEVEEEIEDLKLPEEEELPAEIEPDEEIDLDLFDDTELAAKPVKPKKGVVPKKGKKPEKGKPPKKGKKPEKGKPPKKDLKPKKPKKDKVKAPAKTEIEEIELETKAAPAITPSKIEGDFEPELIKLENKSVQCGICLGVIKTGLMAIRCKCGKLYHESCGVRVGECPRCDRKFILEKLAKMKQEEIETLEEKEESELSTVEFEQQLEQKKKDKRGEFAEILDGLEKRLAKGEISEETYLMLRKKYEK